MRVPLLFGAFAWNSGHSFAEPVLSGSRCVFRFSSELLRGILGTALLNRCCQEVGACSAWSPDLGVEFDTLRADPERAKHAGRIGPASGPFRGDPTRAKRAGGIGPASEARRVDPANATCAETDVITTI